MNPRLAALPHLARFAIAAVMPGSLFAAQTWLIATGQSEGVLALARYAGFLGLLFFAFDGNSGLVPALMRLRHSEATIRAAYRVYRLGILAVCVVALPLCWWLAPDETRALLPFCIGALLLRLPWLDADLDQRGHYHWSMLLQNGWMLPLAVLGALFAPLDATMAGHAALWSSVVLALVHRSRAGPKVRGGTELRPALLEILNFMGAQGLGQIYGRTVLFWLGAGFAGPLPALAVYAKQVFNAAGLVINYLRRIELARPETGMRLSLFGQAAIALAGSVIVVLAAARLDMAAGTVLILIGWQILEKLSVNANYFLQRNNRHDLSWASLIGLVVLGSIGLALAGAEGNVFVFVSFEAVGYGIALLVLGWFVRKRAQLNAGLAS